MLRFCCFKDPLAILQDGTVFTTVATGRSDEVDATVQVLLIVCLLERQYPLTGRLQ